MHQTQLAPPRSRIPSGDISKYWICLSPLNHYCIVAFTKTVSEVLFLGSRRVLVLIHVTQKIDEFFEIPKYLFSEPVSETEGGNRFYCLD